MALVEIDVVGSKTLKRFLDRLVDVLPRQPAIINVVAHGEEALGRDHQSMTRQLSYRNAKSAFSLTVGIDIRCIEQIDAVLERMSDEVLRTLIVDDRSNRQPRTKADRTDFDARSSEGAILHSGVVAGGHASGHLPPHNNRLTRGNPEQALVRRGRLRDAPRVSNPQ